MNEYEVLDSEDIMELHQRIINDFGGQEGTFPDSKEKVNSTLTFMFGEYFSLELYNGLFHKAGYLLYSLTKNHCFLDGNKRIAFNSCEIFLASNGYILDTDKANFIRFVESIASSTIRGVDIDNYIIEIGEFLKKNSISFEFE